MGGMPHQKKNDAKATPATPRDERHSPSEGATTADGGYAEPHGPRSDADGWGEANVSGGEGAGAPESQGHQTGERSYDNGPDDPAAEEAASDAALREPGERGPADASPPTQEPDEKESPDDVDQPATFDGRQRDYGQGGGQGYVHTGKPGAPGPDSKAG